MKRPSNLSSAFGRAVQARRQGFDISQEELAWRAGLHRSYLADIERGARNPTLATIQKLAKALKMPMSSLMQETELAISKRVPA